jgi:hypothetical protein
LLSSLKKQNIIFIIFIFLFYSHHKRAAAELVPLDSNPTHGILPAEEYIPAKLNSLFSVDAYRAFDIGRNVGKVNQNSLFN